MQTPAPVDLEAWLRARTEAELLAWCRRLSRNALRVLLDRFGSIDECEVCPCGDPWCNCTPPRARKSWYLPDAVEHWILCVLEPGEYLPPSPERDPP